MTSISVGIKSKLILCSLLYADLSITTLSINQAFACLAGESSGKSKFLNFLLNMVVSFTPLGNSNSFSNSSILISSILSL